MRDGLAVAVRHRQRLGAARLVLVNLARFRTYRSRSLADFVAERGLEDFAEVEQLAGHKANNGLTTQRVTRRARLIVRQLETLRWLKGLLTEPPRADDNVGAWRHPYLAARLDRFGLSTLFALIDRINGLGPLCYRDLDRKPAERWSAL